MRLAGRRDTKTAPILWQPPAGKWIFLVFDRNRRDSSKTQSIPMPMSPHCRAGQVVGSTIKDVVFGQECTFRGHL